MKYSAPVKTARMGVVRDALLGGRLLIYAKATLLVEAPLSPGTVTGDVVFFPVKESRALADGKPTHAVLANDSGPVVLDLVIGEDVLIDSATIYEGQTVIVVSAALRHA